jgi:hypothetical protein
MSKELQKESFEKGSRNQNFRELFEKAIETRMSNFAGESPFFNKIKEKMKKKRDLGFEKYGEYSFQNSLYTVLEGNYLEHIKEELIDAANYSVFGMFREDVVGDYEKSSHYLNVLIDVCKTLETLKKCKEKFYGNCKKR